MQGVRQKRYQKFAKNGIAWSKWFDWHGFEWKWQLKGKLLNEYRTIYPDGESDTKGEPGSSEKRPE